MNNPKYPLSDLGQSILDFSNSTLSNIGLSEASIPIVRTIILLIITALLSYSIWWISRKSLISLIGTFINKSKTKWDDYLVEKRVFAALAYLIPLLILDDIFKIVFLDYPKLLNFLIKTLELGIVYMILITILRLLATFEKILSEKERLKDKPLQSFFQLGKIIIIIFMIILGLSVGTGQSPIYFLTSLGAMTAIILLIFKDTILGFVGSIQLAANDMVRLGDWITMAKYGADGTVTEINLATVKVQNFDKTITTIPTYSFISDSFKNWRGMEKSQGRRIKRSINIEINSVKFCESKLLTKLKTIDFLNEYIEGKEEAIKLYNQEHNINGKNIVNGKSLTNIGLYRYYIEQYLKSNPLINSNMTLMVRQLSPTTTGIPIEVYCFSKDKEWIAYENIIADIFDHLMATTSYFELSIFERPTGNDIIAMIND